MLEAGNILPVRLERFAALGRGVARVDGRAVLVRRGVAGEAVQVCIERVFPNYALARVVSIQEPIPERVQPPCPHFEVCAGCDWQHLPAATQILVKRGVLAEQIARIGGLELAEEWEIVADPAMAFGYRDKLEFVPVSDGMRWRPGFHGEDAAPVPIEGCLLAPPSFTALAAATLEVLGAQGVLPPAGSVGALPPHLTRLTVQGTEKPDGTLGVTLLLHLKTAPGQKSAPLMRRFAEVLESAWADLQARIPEAQGLALLMSGGEGEKGLGSKRLSAKGGGNRRKPRLEVLRGERVLRKRIGSRLYAVPLNGFFQVNPGMALRLAAQVVEWLTPQSNGGGGNVPQERPVFDLYGGAGLFALPLAQSGRRVICVDHERSSLETGARSAAAEGLEHCQFHRQNLENPGALESLIKRFGQPGAVIVDPPRRGLSARLTTALCNLAPPVLIYISCDGGTFARDAARLAERYHLTTLRGFDQFPQTHHLEIAARFERRD